MVQLAINCCLVRDKALINVTCIITLYRVRGSPDPKCSTFLVKDLLNQDADSFHQFYVTDFYFSSKLSLRAGQPSPFLKRQRNFYLAHLFVA